MKAKQSFFPGMQEEREQYHSGECYQKMLYGKFSTKSSLRIFSQQKVMFTSAKHFG